MDSPGPIGARLRGLPAPVPGHAAEPLTPANTALSDAAIEQRIDFIERRLDERQTHGQVWYWSWMAINGGSMVGLATAAGLSEHEDDQVNNGVQAGLAAIGVADLLLRPLEARYGGAPIRGESHSTTSAGPPADHDDQSPISPVQTVPMSYLGRALTRTLSRKGRGSAERG